MKNVLDANFDWYPTDSLSKTLDANFQNISKMEVDVQVKTGVTDTPDPLKSQLKLSLVDVIRMVK